MGLGRGVKIIEAMAMAVALPVLATNVKGEGIDWECADRHFAIKGNVE
jgi:hypothetical protein